MGNVRRWRSSLTLAITLASASCSSSPDRDNVVDGAHDASAQQDADAQGDADTQHDASSASDPCSAVALREPRATTTYFIAIEEPGADNTACDGLAPTDEGAGHCPFKDFSSERTRTLLTDVSDTRVELRAGTYLISGWDGLRVSGTGMSDDQRVVLSAFPGEHPVLDVPAPDGDGCMTEADTSKPECVRQVLRIAGAYTAVQGLTIHNGLAYHAEINGGAHHLFRCNTLGETVAFPMRSDLFKIDGGANDVQVLHNDFSHFRSQAIDMTDVSDVLIEDNDFHDPIDADAGATGCKLGAHDITIRGNRVHDFGDDPQSHVFSLGGTGTAHDNAFEARAIHVEGNRVWNVPGVLAQLVSCVDCSVTDNFLWNAGGGILVAAAALGLPECGGSPNGCSASAGALFARNRMRDLHGGDDPASANTFLWIEAGEAPELRSDENVYCTEPGTDAHFAWQGMPLDFAGFQTASGTDDTSHIAAPTDPECAF